MNYQTARTNMVESQVRTNKVTDPVLIEALSTVPRELLAELKVGNAEIVEGPLAAGAPGRGPFDVILVGGSVAQVPAALVAQLADGGRLVAVVRRAIGLGQATLTQRFGDVTSSRILFDAAIPSLPEFEAQESFVF